MTYALSEPEPPQAGSVIWRYMDDWKFEDLLKRVAEHEQWKPTQPGTHTVYFNEPGQLWFGLPGSFGDSKEGSFPDPNEQPETYCDRMSALMGLPEIEAKCRKERFLAADTKTIRSGNFFMAQLCGVSCWHANNCESKIMWDDFVLGTNGIAIRSTCQQVECALGDACKPPFAKASPSVCAVGYVDHDSYFLAADGFRCLLSIVQESWSHESEVRFVAKSPALCAIPLQFKKPISLDLATETLFPADWASEKEQLLSQATEQARQAYEMIHSSGQKGFHLPINLKDFILEVVLKPGSAADYESTVRDQLNRVGCSHVPVRRSSF